MIKHKIIANDIIIYENLVAYLRNNCIKIHISEPKRKWIYIGEISNIARRDITKIGGAFHTTFDLERYDGR